MAQNLHADYATFCTLEQNVDVTIDWLWTLVAEKIRGQFYGPKLLQKVEVVDLIAKADGGSIMKQELSSS